MPSLLHVGGLVYGMVLIVVGLHAAVFGDFWWGMLSAGFGFFLAAVTDAAYRKGKI